LKPYIKYLAAKMGWFPLLEALAFRFARLRYLRNNRSFRRQHPEIILPPDRTLYETYQLHYRKFVEDGRLTAQETAAWLRPYMQHEPVHILDWGCGAGRVTQHLENYFEGSIIHGADTDAAMISWNRQQYPAIHFEKPEAHPPTPYPAGKFDLVIGLSVLTHISADLQDAWLGEIHRLLAKGGIALLTTHGAHYLSRLTYREKKEWMQKGFCVQSYGNTGQRRYACYHHPAFLKERLQQLFTILAYDNGQVHPAKMGGQDVWILRK
jgi:SAM-dependent methyltransferase